MGRFILLIVLATLSCTACAPYRRDTTLYQSTGRQKAIVAVLPVVDRTESSELSWDLSRELTDKIRKRIYHSTEAYLLRDSGSVEVAENLITTDLNAIPRDIKRELGAAEFVVVAELIDQSETPYGLNNSSDDNYFHNEVGSKLSVAMRVRVVDIRPETPRVLLQEILTHDRHISRAYLNSNYSKMPWGTAAFRRSPMGLAHDRLVNELVARVEGYIEVSR